MSNAKPLSAVLENIFNTVFEAVNGISKDGDFEVKDLAVEVSLELVQQKNSNRMLSNNIANKCKSFSNRMLNRQDAFYSHFKVEFRPKAKCIR
ncbi:MAG TPA: hypothetical protein VHP38_00020 [Ruminiclostridium sp.]|nr:hypothetical protein [Ruminiclostridium sp.]